MESLAVVINRILHRVLSCKPVTPDRSNPGDPVTTREAERFSLGQCPDCGAEDSFLGGPEGGLSVNVACTGCGAEFNVHLFMSARYPGITGTMPVVDRLSSYQRPRIERLKQVYGIELLPPPSL